MKLGTLKQKRGLKQLKKISIVKELVHLHLLMTVTNRPRENNYTQIKRFQFIR